MARRDSGGGGEEGGAVDHRHAFLPHFSFPRNLPLLKKDSVSFTQNFPVKTRFPWTKKSHAMKSFSSAQKYPCVSLNKTKTKFGEKISSARTVCECEMNILLATVVVMMSSPF